jgi:hypothetical protein
MKLLATIVFCAVVLIAYSLIEKRLNQQGCPVCGYRRSADAANQACPRCDALINSLDTD